MKFAIDYGLYPDIISCTSLVKVFSVLSETYISGKEDSNLHIGDELFVQAICVLAVDITYTNKPPIKEKVVY